MFKKLGILIVLLAAFAVISGIYNNNPMVIAKKHIKHKSLEVGSLKYKVYLFGVIPVGAAIFEKDQIENYNGQKVYHLSARASSLNIFSRFFYAHATVDSYVDFQSLNPVLFRQTFAIKDSPAVVKEAQYDQLSGVMSISGVKRQILPNTQDPLSAIFNLRRTDFNLTKNLKMSLNTNQKNYVLAAESEVKDLLISGQGHKLVFLKAQIYRQDKNPYHRSIITMVLLNEKENIPVLIKAFASGVLVTARLIDS